MNHRVLEGIKEFILGGNASFTIFQEPNKGKEGVAIKYRVKKNDNGTCWFIYTENANLNDMISEGNNLKYQGYLKRDLSFNIGSKGDKNYNQQAIKGLLWVLNHSEKLPSVVHVYHHGKCSKCGRRLTDLESLRCGLGPTCRKKVGKIG